MANCKIAFAAYEDNVVAPSEPNVHTFVQTQPEFSQIRRKGLLYVDHQCHFLTKKTISPTSSSQSCLDHKGAEATGSGNSCERICHNHL